MAAYNNDYSRFDNIGDSSEEDSYSDEEDELETGLPELPEDMSSVASPDPVAVAEARRQASIRRTAERPEKLRLQNARVASAVSAGVAALRDRSPQLDRTLWPRLEGGDPVAGPPPRVRTLRVARRIHKPSRFVRTMLMLPSTGALGKKPHRVSADEDNESGPDMS